MTQFYNSEFEAKFPKLREQLGYEPDSEFYPSVIDGMIRFMETKNINTSEFVDYFKKDLDISVDK